MKILDLNAIDYVAVDEAAVETISITIEDMNMFHLGIADIVAKLENIFSTIEVDKDKTYHFKIEVKDDSIPASSRLDFCKLIGNYCLRNLVCNTAREREARLAVPDHIKKHCKLGYLIVLQAINKQTKIDKLACTININGHAVKVV